MILVTTPYTTEGSANRLRRESDDKFTSRITFHPFVARCPELLKGATIPMIEVGGFVMYGFKAVHQVAGRPVDEWLCVANFWVDKRWKPERTV